MSRLDELHFHHFASIRVGQTVNLYLDIDFSSFSARPSFDVFAVHS